MYTLNVTGMKIEFRHLVMAYGGAFSLFALFFLNFTTDCEAYWMHDASFVITHKSLITFCFELFLFPRPLIRSKPARFHHPLIYVFSFLLNIPIFRHQISTMNRIFSLAIIGILLTVSPSCKKEHIGNTGTITATVNGVPYASASASGEARPGKATYSIFTSANSAKTEGITLYVDSLAVGTYAFNSGGGNALQYSSGGVSYGSVPGSGSITITSVVNNTISGTFSGVLGIDHVDSIVVTGGVFTNCAY